MTAVTHLDHEGTRSAVASQCHVKATLAAHNTGVKTVKNTGAIIYSIDGIMYTKAALSNQAITITHRFDGSKVTTNDPAYVQPAETEVIYLFALNAAGTLAVIQGSYAGQEIKYSGDLSRVLTGAGGVPAVPKGYAVFGAMKVVTATATTFTPTSTNLDASGVTATFYDLALAPASL